MKLIDSQITSILYLALESPHGLLLEANDADRVIYRFYRVRHQSGLDGVFEDLRFRKCDLDGGNVIIVKEGGENASIE